MARLENWRGRVVPLSLHGDAVPCVAVGKPGTKSFDVLSLQGILGRGSTKELKLYIFGLFELSKTDAGMDRVWKELNWSLEHLLTGLWPAVDSEGNAFPAGTLDADRAGSKLAGGYSAVVWALKADLDHLTKAWALRHYASNHPCELCRRNRGLDVSYRFNNFRMDAAWKTALITAEEWRAENPLPHPVFRFSYMSNQNIEVDELHVMHLGTSMYMFGSILFTLVFDILAESPADNMKLVWKEITSAYRELRPSCAYTNLTIASFCEAERPHAAYPKLKGKGAEVKDLAEPLLQVWEKLRRPRHKEDSIVSQMLKHQCAIQTILTDNTHEFFWPRQMRKLCVFTSMEFCRITQCWQTRRTVRAGCDGMLRLSSTGCGTWVNDPRI